MVLRDINTLFDGRDPANPCELLRKRRAQMIEQLRGRRQYQQCLEAYGMSDPTECGEHARPARQLIAALAKLDQRIAVECDGLQDFGDGVFGPPYPLTPQLVPGP